MAPGEQLLGDQGQAGQITSAAGNLGLARVRWASREGPWITTGGTEVAPRSRQEAASR